MSESMTITEAKARLSELVGRLLYRREKIFITRKGKRVAVLLPIATYEKLTERGSPGLLGASSALAALDAEVEAMAGAILAERAQEKGREVDL
jgi:prevent-host-death family protein